MFWNTVTAAPHRAMFLAGGMQTLLVMLWWLANLGACLALPILPAPVLPDGPAHAWAIWAALLLGLIGELAWLGWLFTDHPPCSTSPNSSGCGASWHRSSSPSATE